ncbi:MAG: polysaccharide biosynthesis/export family protein [Gemmatimonadaceae bacterium]
MTRPTLALFMLLACRAPSPAPAPSPDSAQTGSQAVLQPGDIVRLTVWRRPEFSGEFEIASNGVIKHPLYQHVPVARMPLAEVNSRVRTYLLQFDANPEFIIEPLFRVAVGGEVQSPNLYRFPRETTIPQAIALAGGVTGSGRLDRVRLIREGQTQSLDLTHPDTKWAQVPIRSGDQILVTRRRNYLLEYIGPIASLTGVIVSIVALTTR